MQEQKPLYRLIAASVEALRDSERRGWTDRAAYYAEELAELMKYLPAKGGLEQGSELCLDECTPERLVFSAMYHHLDAEGNDYGWTEHKVIVAPTFDSITVQVTGINLDNVKRYLQDVFYRTLATPVRPEVTLR